MSGNGLESDTFFDTVDTRGRCDGCGCAPEAYHDWNCKHSFGREIGMSSSINKYQPHDFQKHDSGKRRYDLLPYDALDEIVKVLEHGAAKYDDHNWTKGTAWSRYWSASLRHLTAYWRGEDNDPESGLNHLAHAACAILFLISYSLRGTGTDDRPDTTPPAPPDSSG